MLSLSLTPLTPIRRRCSHTLLSSLLNAHGFVLVGKKIIIIIVKDMYSAM